MLERFKGIIEKLENLKTPSRYFVMSFIFIVTFRSFLECFSDTDVWGTVKFLVIIHYFLFYITLATSLILLFHLVTKINIEKISRVILSGFTILVSVPIFDLIISKGKGYDIAYLLPEIHGNLLSRFLTFFGEFYSSGMGITPGIRIEVVFVLLGSFIYFYLKGINFIKNLVSIFFVYAIIFMYLSLPFFAKWVLILVGLEYRYSPVLMYNFSLLILFLVGVLLLYFINKKYFKIILKDIRIFRVLYFELMFFLGIVLALRAFDFVLTTDNLFSFIFIPISIASAWMYSVVTNNIEDYEIDKISNKDRPLIKEKIDLILYTRVSWFLFFTSFIYAGFASFTAFFVILLFIGNYFLYSMPPFRLKRIPFFSKMLISLNSLALIMLGFSLVSGLPIESIPFPPSIFILVLIILTGIINFIDIKDYEGDKQAGIKTLPVLLGLKKSKRFISVFFAVAYLLVCFLAKEWSTVAFFFVAGCLQVYFINRKDYKEKYVFVVILSSILYLILKPLLF